MIEEPSKAAVEVSAFDAGFKGVVVAGETVVSKDGVGPIEERSVRHRVLVAEGLIVERVARGLIESVKCQHAEALKAEGAFHFCAAVEWANVG